MWRKSHGGASSACHRVRLNQGSSIILCFLQLSFVFLSLMIPNFSVSLAPFSVIDCQNLHYENQTTVNEPLNLTTPTH